MFNLTPWKKQSNGGDIKVRNNRERRFEPLALFRDEFNSLWDRYWGDWDREFGMSGQAPSFGLNERFEDKENAYVFQADLPGFDPDEIDVKVSGTSLVVKAERKDEQKDKERSSYHYGSFQRYFQLPQGVDSESIEAKYHNGVLEVHLPKTEEDRPKRIPVKAH
jgi:HSP20 family protein